MTSYPPMPWHLVTRGTTLITLHPVRIRDARQWVPRRFRILPIVPGYTLGGLFVTDYGPGSDLQYNELIAAGAAVWHDRRLCPWVTHLFVDSEASVEGGRKLLGVPKRLASFTRDRGEQGDRVTVGEAGRPICTFEVNRRLWLWRQRLRAVSLHQDVRDDEGRTVVAQGNELNGGFGAARARVEIAADSPLKGLGLGRPLLAGCARDLEAVLGGAPFYPSRTLTMEEPGAA
jgi:hypothetical protein